MYQYVGKYRSILIRLRHGSRKKGKVLLACSGGPSSISLVDLTKNIMHTLPNEKKKIQVVPEAVICHIDESSLFDSMSGSAETLRARMKEHYPNFEFICHPIEDVFSPQFVKNVNFDKYLSSEGTENGDYEHWAKYAYKTSSVNHKEQLQSLFNSIKKSTAKEDLLWHIKMQMLITVAQREGCTYIFFADSATRQAIKMISWTAKGRGYSLPLDISVDNEQTFGVGIMRPMKDMLSKEVGLYNYFSGIDKLVIPPYNFGTMMPAKSSIDRLTEDFINGLERDFPSTVSTVCRTVGKLTPSKDMDYKQTCAMCLMPRQTGIGEWRKHITVTEVPGADTKPSNDGCCGNNQSCSTTNGCKDNKVDINQHLCYSCQVNFKDYNATTIQLLPPYVVENTQEQSRNERLLNEIKDFLINDDE
ncbi:Cytoplasmic tRNA 2-thiolation protein 2 [Rhizopus azygosporus]|uniref:Cytoplasmic tRNA 2-thiolation protein 2 n=2 Tax=Rhizopus TaxID=4842 RepID=A0A367J5V5_RHIAZ|nr:Cytoplasmic tRNA 2-thiolation protein 2 [Rhizopus azygosporus]